MMCFNFNYAFSKSSTWSFFKIVQSLKFLIYVDVFQLVFYFFQHSMMILYSLNNNSLYEASVDLFLPYVFLLGLLPGTNFLVCLVISYCDLLILHGNCLWDFLSPVKMLSSRQNLLFLLPSCLKLMLACFNLKLGLKFWNYPNYIKFDLKKRVTSVDFCG